MLEILLVDDDQSTRELLEYMLRDQGHHVATAVHGAQAMDRIGQQSFDLVITDVRMPGVDGFELFRCLQQRAPQTDVVLMTAFSNVGDAVTAIKEKAADYLSKPFDTERLLRIVDNIAEQRRLKAELDEARGELAMMGTQLTLLGKSPALAALRDRIDVLADSDCPILVTGESGTGKDMIARAIHRRSGRRDKPFIAVNCASFPETLLEAELFGHEKGAFTGAIARREGRFQAANGGTLFLDEIGEMPLPFQAKVLRVLQEGRFEPVGTNQTVQVDVRIISATNRNIKQWISEGKFREDLYYRINLFQLQIPPLRERRSDLPILVEYFLKKYSTREVPPQLSPRAWAALSQYAFPGNVRELEHALRHALILSGSGPLDLQHFPDDVRGEHTSPGLLAPKPRLPLDEAWKQFEREYLIRALESVNGSRTQAAECLGISRKSLWAKLKAYNISDESLAESIKVHTSE